ncbi:abortive phage infection protein [Streptococcus suis]|nr:abortive phage infection protein [Streptococcus suis]
MAALASIAQTCSDGWFFCLRSVQMSSFSHKSFEEQVALLESRGMLFSGEQDKKKAEQKLSIISYYKLKEFARPFSKIVTVDGVRQINYQNTPFKKITVRYYQDKRLGLHLLDALEDIEVALKPK